MVTAIYEDENQASTMTALVGQRWSNTLQFLQVRHENLGNLGNFGNGSLKKQWRTIAHWPVITEIQQIQRECASVRVGCSGLQWIPPETAFLRHLTPRQLGRIPQNSRLL